MDAIQRPLVLSAATLAALAQLCMAIFCVALLVGMIVQAVKAKKRIHGLRLSLLLCIMAASVLRMVGCILRGLDLWPNNTLWDCIQRGTVWQLPMYGWLLAYTFLLFYILTFNGNQKIEKIVLPISVIANIVFDIVHLTLNILFRAIPPTNPIQKPIYYVAILLEISAYFVMGIALVVVGFGFVALLLRSPSIRQPGHVRDLPLVYLIVKMAVSTVCSGLIVLILILTGIVEALVAPLLGIPLWISDSLMFYTLYRVLELFVSCLLLATVFLKVDPLINFIRAQNRAASHERSFKIAKSTSSLGIGEKSESDLGDTPIQMSTPDIVVSTPEPNDATATTEEENAPPVEQ